MPKQARPRSRKPGKSPAINARSIVTGVAIGLLVGAGVAGVMLVWLLKDDSEPARSAAIPAPVADGTALPSLKPSLPDLSMALPSRPPAPPPTVRTAPQAAPEKPVPPPAAATEKPVLPAAATEKPVLPPAHPVAPQLAALPAAPPRPATPGGTPTWRRNAVAVAPAVAGAPRIAIVIDDLGPNHRGSQGIIALPGPLTLAFLPYAADVGRMVDTARRGGHEILVHMPMEPMNGNVDPGPGALRVLLPKDELRRRIDDGLTKFGGLVGLNNHMGSRFTADPKAMAVLMDDVAARGLLFLDSRTTVDTVAEAMARARSVPFVARDVFLDNDQAADAVEQQLAETERAARRKGYAVAIGHPHAATRSALAAWLPQAAQRGFHLVPISSLARVSAVEQARH